MVTAGKANGSSKSSLMSTLIGKVVNLITLRDSMKANKPRATITMTSHIALNNKHFKPNSTILME